MATVGIDLLTALSDDRYAGAGRYLPLLAVALLGLAGLILGHFFSRILRPVRDTVLYGFVNHAKGGLVLCCAVTLCASLLSSGFTLGPYGDLLLAASISFYFGSRS